MVNDVCTCEDVALEAAVVEEEFLNKDDVDRNFCFSFSSASD